MNVTTGHAPADLFLRGGFRTQLKALRCPGSESEEEDDDELDEAVRVREAAVKASVKDRYDTRHHTAPRHLAEGDAVFVQQASGATERATVLEANAHEATVETEGVPSSAVILIR